MISKSTVLTQLERAMELHTRLIPLLERNLASSAVFSGKSDEKQTKTIEEIEKFADIFKKHQTTLQAVAEEVKKLSAEVL